MSRLALTPPLGRYEPATSFASRLAALNGCAYVQDFCSDLGMNWKRIIKGDNDDLKSLAKISGADSVRLSRHTAKVISNRVYKLHDEVLTQICYARGQQRICPVCLMNDVEAGGPFASKSRSYWNISQIRHCSKHKIELIALPDASYPRDLHDFTARLRDAKLETLPHNPGKPTAFETYLSNRIKGEPSGLWLDRIDFDAVAGFCEGLGVLMCHGQHVRQEQLSSQEFAIAANEAFSACLNGKNGIEKALSGAQRRSTGEKPGHYADFGPFSRWLARRQSCPRHTDLVDTVRNFIWTNYPIEKGDIVLGKPCPHRRLHNVSSASKEYGISVGRMYAIQRDFATRSGLPPHHSNRFYFDVAKHSDLLSEVANGFRRERASQFLGCSRSSFDKIVAAGLITPVLKLDEFTESYSEAELQRLISNCMSSLQTGDYDPDDFISIRNATRKTKMSLFEVIDALSEGKVRYLPPLAGRANLGSILINWRELRLVSGNDWPDGYTKHELKRILRVNDSTVGHLTREKYIVGKTYLCARTGVKGEIISQCDLDRFLRKYVTLGILAHRIGTQAKHVSAKLDKLGVNPLQFPQRYSKIYLRADVDGKI